MVNFEWIYFFYFIFSNSATNAYSETFFACMKLSFSCILLVSNQNKDLRMTVSLQKEKWTVQNSVRLLETDAQKKFNISSIKENDLFLFCVEFVFMLF